MKSFEEQLAALNPAQRQAVQTIEGPVLVVAGPGTGKTQLLSMRAANIVRQTDTAPQNILCLTFTESAALAMQQRLIKLMGPEGNKVAVHTFHSFGAEIINTNPEHFYNGARFTPADEIASYDILRTIFDDLPASNPLAKKMNGEFTALKDAQSSISHLKRAGLLPQELQTTLDHNDAFCNIAEPLLQPLFAARLSKKDIPAFATIAVQLANIPPADPPLYAKPLGHICARELAIAVEEAATTGKTTPLTAWRNKWLEKNNKAVFVFKDRMRTRKLRALVGVYEQYRQRLAEAELFDFDDMVSLVAHTLETTPELRYNLQERYLYIMVDEFQDTNGAQLRLLSAIAENPINEDRPNILAVGDDDQAIYAFQGAELSNILDFTNRYRDVAIITLTDNYRSTAPILQHARSVITQGKDRLETTLQNINKQLTAHSQEHTTTQLHQFDTPEAEYQWIADQCAAQIKNDCQPGDIAILARNHKYLVDMLPYLHAAGLHVAYERRNNVLENPQVSELITLAEVVAYLSEQRFDLVESLLPELLSYPFWGIKTKELWQLSLRAYKERRMWLELMVDSEGRLHQIAEFLIVSSHQALHEPLDTMLDILLGANEIQAPHQEDTEQLPIAATGPSEQFVSPYRAYYFTEERLKQNPTAYVTLLGNLRALRRAAAGYKPGYFLTLSNLIDLVELHERTNTPIVDSAQHNDDQDCITLMTAHKSKGLEFNKVFIVGCQDTIWGRKARRPSSQISFPHNLPITPSGEHYDDALRLFFVAMTRAKHSLVLTSHTTDAKGKNSILAEFLQSSQLSITQHNAAASALEPHTPNWQNRWTNISHTTRDVLLKPTLESYKLSATHINNFLDVTRGGPQTFLLQNLLRFPQAMTPSQAFGHAIHAVLQRAHTHLSATGERRPLEDILHDFEIQLTQAHLSERDMNYQLEKGSEVLQSFLSARYDTFTPDQKAERNFYGQNVVINDVRLTGAIDLMDVNEQDKTITVIDYKTGKGHSTWRAVTDFDRIKLHKYKQQLMLYKLLVEHSRDFAGYTVVKGVLDFVEPDPDGELHQLELAFNADDLTDYTKLLSAVWRHIMALDFPDISQYDQTLNGILAFERDLLL